MKDTDKHARPELAMTETIRQLPLACQDETAAVEFIEKQRWGKTPCCAHCGSVKVYKMLDKATGQRSKRFLRRCRERGCGKQYTVRIGTVYEESRIELRHWCYAFWRAATSKKGVAALEIMRHCGLSYKSALFLMHRIRWAMTPHTKDNAKKMHGTVEADETYVGGKPRPKGRGVREVWSTKTPVFGVVERGGKIHRKVIADVSGKTVYDILKKRVGVDARVMTDEAVIYERIGEHFDGGHHTVHHTSKEYVRGDVHTNTIESSFALIKRGLMGIHHSVSKKHLHRYITHYDFLWNCRKMNDGERTVLAIQSAEGKRLMYRKPIEGMDSQASDGALS